jgi:hypothetical protein
MKEHGAVPLSVHHAQNAKWRLAGVFELVRGPRRNVNAVPLSDFMNFGTKLDAARPLKDHHHVLMTVLLVRGISPWSNLKVTSLKLCLTRLCEHSTSDGNPCSWFVFVRGALHLWEARLDLVFESLDHLKHHHRLQNLAVSHLYVQIRKLV